MKILGIGNAIVDVLCKVSDHFLNKNSLTKGTMKLIDEKECYQSFPCLIFDILMFLTHYFGIFILIMGILSLLGNENTGVK